MYNEICALVHTHNVCTRRYMHVYSKIKKKITNDWTSNFKPVFGA